MDLGDAYEDYAGELRCWGCQAVLEVSLQEGKLKSMRRNSGTARPPDRGTESPENPSPATPAESSAAGRETG